MFAVCSVNKKPSVFVQASIRHQQLNFSLLNATLLIKKDRLISIAKNEANDSKLRKLANIFTLKELKAEMTGVVALR